MKKRIVSITLVLITLLSLTGCTIGSKTTSMSIIYGVTVVLSLLLLAGYCCLVRSRHSWFILLFSSVSVVNIGYFLLAISSTLENALFANRIAYLGSVFLMPAMFMTILNVCKIKFKKWLPISLLALGLGIFLIAASPGYLDIYYKEVSLEIINGVAVLNKVYGPLHILYLFYLLGYFAAMVSTIIYSIVKKKIASTIHCVILISAVFVNIGVWLLEQFVKLDIEILSISYIISELFLLGLYLILQESEKLLAAVNNSSNQSASPKDTQNHNSQDFVELCKYFEQSLPTLTHTERTIYNFYLEGKSTKEIMATLSITENTLKYHNKNIYSKLGVQSRKKLIEVATALKNK